MDGADKLKRTVFGEATLAGWKDNDKRKTMTEFAEDIKGKLPKVIGRGLMIGAGKTILFSKAGLLGSIFLPGGPIGAVIAGTGASLLMESEKFKTWLFGEKDPDNLDRRLGGVIPKNVQDFYEENKSIFKIGGLVGAGFGLLPSFFLPGGPLTGAIMGIASGFITKSDAFQEFLYGADFKDGDKKLMNGALGRAYSNAKGWFKEKGIDPKLATFLGGIGGVAGTFGLLPSFFLPAGPIGGALLGVAAGIGASSNKFQEWLFGEEGFDGKRSGGVIDKLKTYLDIEIFDSIKITLKSWNMKISDFLYDNIAEPFLSALDPMKQIVSNTLTNIKNIFKSGWDKLNENVLNVFKDNVIKPFGESLTKYVVDPLKKMLNKSFSILGKVVGGIISAPFKLLGFLGNRADKKANKKNATEEEKEKRQKYHDARDERQRRRDERREKVQEEINEMKDKQSRDREFFKRDGRFRNQEAKDKYERQEKEKQLWYQQHIAESGEETAERLINIDKAIETMLDKSPKMFTKAEDRLFNELQDLKKTLVDQLNYWKDRGYVDISYLKREKTEKPFEKPQDPFMFYNKAKQEMNQTNKNDAINRIKMGNPNADIKDSATDDAKKYQDPKINSIVDLLRRKGQSHDEGLDRVPYDGYVAELHEGEKIVPASETDEKDTTTGKQETDKMKLFRSIRKHTRTIADEVKGQLYGVGSNIHHIRKILQDGAGIKDTELKDLQDRNVNDYGFFGKMFNKIKNTAFHPFESLRDKISGPVDWIKEKVGAVIDGVKTGITKVVSSVGKVVDAFLEIPSKVISTTLDVASTVIKGSADILFKGINLALKGTTTVVADLYKGTRFLVTSIAKSFVPALVGAGKLAGKVLQGLGTAGKFAIETVAGLGKGLYTVTKDVLGFGYNLSKDVLKGMASVTKGLFKGAFNIVKGTAKGIIGGVKGIFSGGASIIGKAFGLTSVKDKTKPNEVKIIGGSLDNIVNIESVKSLDKLNEIDKINSMDSLKELKTVVNEVKFVSKGTAGVGETKSKQSVEDKIKDQINNMNINDEINKAKPTSTTDIDEKIKDQINNMNINQAEDKSKQESEAKKQYKDQIKMQTEASKKEREDIAKEQEAKKDKEHASRLTADYVQEQKRIKKEQKLDFQYKTETMKDIDSTEKIAAKQYKFWDNLFGKNGVVETKLNSLWEWITKLAPTLLAWLKGSTLGRIFSNIFGGTGFFPALKTLLTTLAPTFVGLLIDNLDKSKRDEIADQYNLSDQDAYYGIGDPNRYDTEDGYIENYDRKYARDKLLKNGVRDVLKNKSAQNLINATGKVFKNAIPYAQKGFEKVKNVMPKTANTLGNLFNKIGSKFGRQQVTDIALDTAERGTVELLDETGKTIFKGGQYSIVDITESAAKSGKGTEIVTKFVKLLKSALKTVINFVSDKLGDTAIKKSASKIINKLIAKFTGSAAKEIAEKCATKITKFIAKKGLGAATYFILDGATALWDIGTGQTKSETANLFGIKQDQVNTKMRIISASLKAITNFSIIGVINLANEITSELFNINFLRSVACAIYDAISSSDDSKELDKNQSELEQELEKYNKENGTSLTKEAYLDKINPSIFSKIMDNNWVKNFTTIFDKGDAANALGKNKDDVTLWDRIKFGFGHTGNTILNLFRSKENKLTDSQALIGKTQLLGDTGLPVLDEKGNPVYKEDVEAGRVTADGTVLKEGSTESTNSTSSSTQQPQASLKDYGFATTNDDYSNINDAQAQQLLKTMYPGMNFDDGGAGYGDGPYPMTETDYQDIVANFDNKSVDAQTWLQNKTNDNKTLLSTIGAGFDLVKQTFFRWYTGEDDQVAKMFNKEPSKVNMHERRIWKTFNAFNWLSNLFRSDENKLTTEEEFKQLNDYFGNVQSGVGAWLSARLSDVNNLMGSVQNGFNNIVNTITNSTDNINLPGSPTKTPKTKKFSLKDAITKGIKSGANFIMNSTPVGKVVKFAKGLFGYDQGTPWVPDTQVALIHEGEMVVPADKNPLNPDNQTDFVNTKINDEKKEVKEQIESDKDKLNKAKVGKEINLDSKKEQTKTSKPKEDKQEVKEPTSFTSTSVNINLSKDSKINFNLDKNANLTISGLDKAFENIMKEYGNKFENFEEEKER